MSERVGSVALGSLLRAHRQRRDLTIEGLAEVSGVSDRTISDIERGVSTGPQPRTVSALADALGLGPDERSDFLAVARAGRVAPGSHDRAVSSEPHRVADFSGRGNELSLLGAMIDEGSAASDSPPTAIVISGPPGVGKTTLALEFLHEVADGAILFVDLRGFEVAALTPLEVLQALLRQVTGGRDDSATLDDAGAAWRARTSLSPATVFLDNAASEAQVRPVLATSGAIRVVVTSRRTLAGLESSQRLVLGPLHRDDSVAFLRRSIAEGQDAAGDLDEIAGYCSDLPLALRIAGARIASRPQWTVEDYAQRLRSEEHRLRNLVAGDLGVESTFALSYAALDGRSQEFFRSLCLLRGSSFSASMAAAIHGLDPADVTELLDGLVDLGLVESLRGERYRMHDLLRLFAEACLRKDESDDSRAKKRDRLQRWIIETTISAGLSYQRDVVSAGPAGYVPAPAARRWLFAESAYWMDALREAARQGRHDDVVRVVDALDAISARWANGLDTWEISGLAIASARVTGNMATLTRELSNHALAQFGRFDDIEAARATAHESMALARDTGDDLQLGEALSLLGRFEIEAGDPSSARDFLNRAVELFRRHGQVNFEIEARSWLVRTALADRQFARAECDHMLALLENPGVWAIARVHALGGVVRVLLALEDWDAALEASERMVTEMTRFEDEPDFLARAYRHRGFAQLGLGRNDLAQTDFEAALAIARTYAPPWWTEEIEKTLEAIKSSD